MEMSGIMSREMRAMYGRRASRGTYIALALLFIPWDVHVTEPSERAALKVQVALLASVRVHRDSVHSLIFTPDGTSLVAGSADATISLCGLPNGRPQLWYRG